MSEQALSHAKNSFLNKKDHYEVITIENRNFRGTIIPIKDKALSGTRPVVPGLVNTPAGPGPYMREGARDPVTAGTGPGLRPALRDPVTAGPGSSADLDPAPASEKDEPGRTAALCTRVSDGQAHLSGRLRKKRVTFDRRIAAFHTGAWS